MHDLFDMRSYSQLDLLQLTVSLHVQQQHYMYLDLAVMLQAELFAELAVDVALIQWNLFIKTL